MFEKASWMNLLEQYTQRHLTFENDRLYALLGVAAHLKEVRQDHYFQQYGVWEDDLLIQLLWNPMEKLTSQHQSPPLPSWRWAAKAGSKDWHWGSALCPTDIQSLVTTPRVSSSG